MIWGICLLLLLLLSYANFNTVNVFPASNLTSPFWSWSSFINVSNTSFSFSTLRFLNPTAINLLYSFIVDVVDDINWHSFNDDSLLSSIFIDSPFIIESETCARIAIWWSDSLDICLSWGIYLTAFSSPSVVNMAAFTMALRIERKRQNKPCSQSLYWKNWLFWKIFCRFVSYRLSFIQWN